MIDSKTIMPLLGLQLKLDFSGFVGFNFQVRHLFEFARDKRASFHYSKIKKKLYL